MFRFSMSTVLAALVAFGPAQSVGAEEPAAETAAEPTAAQLSDEAVRQFEQGEYDAAIELFEQAHAKDPQPNYLYNIARVHEEKGDFEAAVQWYQAFVGEPRVDLEARANAIDRLEVLRAAIEQTRGGPQPPPPAVERERRREQEPKTRWTERPEQDASPSDRIRKARIAGYTLMGVGGAALVVGGVFGGLALGKNKDAERAQFVDTADDLREQARTQARVADAMLATGGILAGVGLITVLATLGSKHRSQRQTAWVPIAGRTELGLGVSHRF